MKFTLSWLKRHLETTGTIGEIAEAEPILSVEPIDARPHL